MSDQAGFRADQIGSLLRPEELLEARRRHDAGAIDDRTLRHIEDEQIAAAVRLQERAGIDVLTDGEFRRRDFRAGFADAVDGIATQVVERPWRTHEGVITLPSAQFAVAGRLRQHRRLAAGEADYLATLTSRPIKATLISPGFLADRFWRDGVSGEFYESREALAHEVAAITRTEIEALLAEGVSYVQLDNPGYSAYLGDYVRDTSRARAGFELMLETDIAAVTDIERPAGTTIGLHVCRGNQSSMWLGEGDYEPIAEQLFGRLPVDRFLLEYDDERAGSFRPLRLLGDGKTAVLGLVSTKRAALESADELKRRIDEASRYVELDRLALSPQCGFASVAEGGNDLSRADQEAKLQLVARVAREVWG